MEIFLLGILLAPLAATQLATSISIDQLTAYTQKGFELQGGLISFQLPDVVPTPSDATIDILYQSSTPNFLSISGNEATIDTSATAGSYNIDVLLTDLNSSQTTDFVFMLELWSCFPKNAVISPADVSVYTTQMAVSALASADDSDTTKCGQYFLSLVDVSFSNIILIQGLDIAVSAAYGTTPVAMQTVEFNFMRASNLTMQTLVTFQLTVVECIPTLDLEAIGDQTFYLDVTSQTIPFSLAQSHSDSCTEPVGFTILCTSCQNQPTWIDFDPSVSNQLKVSGLQPQDRTLGPVYLFTLLSVGSLSGATASCDFSISIKCTQTASFTWNGITLPVKIALTDYYSGMKFAVANNGACPVIQELTLNNSSTLPDFFKYDATTFTINLTPTLISEVGFYEIEISVKLADDPSQQQTFVQQFEVFCAVTLAIDQLTSFSSKSFELLGNEISFLLPDVIVSPNDAIVNIQYDIITAPSFIGLSNNQVLIDTNATPGMQTITIRITDYISSITTDFQFTLTLWSCYPTNAIVNPSQITLYTTQPAVGASVSAQNMDQAVCGAYDLQLTDPSLGGLIAISGLNLQISAAFGTQPATQLIQLILQQTSDASKYMHFDFELNILACFPSVDITTIGDLTYFALDVPQVIQISLVARGADSCIEAVNFSLTCMNCQNQLTWIDFNPSNSTQLIAAGIQPSDSNSTPYQFTLSSIGQDSQASSEITFSILVIDCSQQATFVWNTLTIPNKIALSETFQGQKYALVNDGVCPLTQVLTVNNTASLPSFFAYDPQTFTFSISPTQTTNYGCYEIEITVQLTKGQVSPQQDTFTWIFCVWGLKSITFDPATTYTTKTFEIVASVISFDLPNIILDPIDAIVNIQFTSNSASFPAFVSIVGSQVQIDGSTATPTTFVVQVSWTDQKSGVSAPFSFQLVLLSCFPSSAALSSPSLTIYTTRSAVTSTFTANNHDPFCGPYDLLLVDTSMSTLVSINSLTLSISAPFGFSQGVYSVALLFQRVSNTTMQTSSQQSITVNACTPSLTLTSPIGNIQAFTYDNPKSIPVSKANQASIDCIETVSYSITCSSCVSMPTWVNFDSTNPANLIVQGLQLSDVNSGPIYTFQVSGLTDLSQVSSYTTFTITVVDCTDPVTFVWSTFQPPARFPLTTSYSGQLFATANGGGCPVVHALTLNNSSTLPVFITFTSANFTISINPSLVTQVGIYEIEMKATMTFGLNSPQVSLMTALFEVYCATSLSLDPTTTFTSKQFELLNQTITFDMPRLVILPTDALVNKQQTFNTAAWPSTFTISNNTATISASAVPAVFTVSVQYKELISGLTLTFSFPLTLVSCVPKNALVSSSSVAIFTQQPAVSATVTYGNLDAFCGAYNLSLVDLSFSNRVSISGFNLSISAPYLTTPGTWPVQLSVYRASNSTMETFATFTLTVTACQSSIILAAIPSKVYIAEETILRTIPISVASATNYCVETINFALTCSCGSNPTWITWNQVTKPQLDAQNIPATAAGNYTFTVTAIGSVTTTSNQTLFNVLVVDCRFKNTLSSPSALTITRLGPSKNVTFSIVPLPTQCSATYAIAQPSGSTLGIQLLDHDAAGLSYFTYSLSAQFTESLGARTVTFSLNLLLSPNYTSTLTCIVTVNPCVVTTFTSPVPSSSAFYLIASAQKHLTFPTFTYTPACQEALSYQVNFASPLVIHDPIQHTLVLQGSNVANAAQFSITIKATTAATLLSFTHTINVNAIDCTPKNLTSSPPSLATPQLGLSVTSAISKNPSAAECGTFSYSIAASPGPFVSMLSNSITLAPILADPIGIYQVTVKCNNNLVPLSSTFNVTLTIIDCKLQQLTSSGPYVVPTAYIIGGPPVEVTLPSFMQTPDCTYTGLYRDGQSNFGFSPQPDGKWLMQSLNTTTNGLKTLAPRICFANDPLCANLTPLPINIKKVVCKNITAQTYTIWLNNTSNPQSYSLVNLNSLILSPEASTSDLLFNIMTPDGSLIPPWILFDQSTASFNVDVTDTNLAGTYTFYIAITAPSVHPGWNCTIPDWQLKLAVEVIPPAPPVRKPQLILKPIPLNQDVQQGAKWSYQIPAMGYFIQDSQTAGKTITLKITIKNPLVIHNPVTNTLILAGPIQDKDIGTQAVVKYELDDGTNTAEFVQVVSFKQEINNTVATVQVAKPVETQFTPFDPSTLWQGKNQVNITTETTDISKLVPIEMSIKSIGTNGIIEIQFNQQMVVPAEFAKRNVTQTTTKYTIGRSKQKARVLGIVENGMRVAIIPGAESDIANLTYTWNISDFTSMQMQIALNFENAKYVSAHQDLDSVQVTFLDPDIFQSLSGSPLTEPVSLTQTLPRMIAAGSVASSIASVANSGATGVKSFVIGNVILSTVLSASLSNMFSMVEAQQLVCIITCSQITLPPLSAVFISQFFQISNFDLLNVQFVWDRIFYMPPVPAEGDNFNAVGFNDTYFLHNVGSIILSIVGFLLLQAASMILRRFKKKSTYIKYNWGSIDANCFWHMPIRVVLESYSILSLSALITVTHQHWSRPGPILDTLLAFVGLTLVIVFPFIALYLLIRYFQDLNSKSMRAKFGSLYDELDTHNVWIVTFRLWFIIRRLCFSLIVIFVDKLGIQVLLWFGQQVVSVVILGFGYPFEDRAMWVHEMWNEVFILVSIYFTMFFSPYITDIDLLNMLGYVFCGVLFFHLGVSILLIAISTGITKLREFKMARIVRKELARNRKLRKAQNRQQQRESKQQFLKRRATMAGSTSLLAALTRIDTTKDAFMFNNDEVDTRGQSRLEALRQAAGKLRHKRKLDIVEENESFESHSFSSYDEGDTLEANTVDLGPVRNQKTTLLAKGIDSEMLLLVPDGKTIEVFKGDDDQLGKAINFFTRFNTIKSNKNKIQPFAQESPSQESEPRLLRLGLHNSKLKDFDSDSEESKQAAEKDTKMEARFNHRTGVTNFNRAQTNQTDQSFSFNRPSRLFRRSIDATADVGTNEEAYLSEIDAQTDVSRDRPKKKSMKQAKRKMKRNFPVCKNTEHDKPVLIKLPALKSRNIKPFSELTTPKEEPTQRPRRNLKEILKTIDPHDKKHAHILPYIIPQNKPLPKPLTNDRSKIHLTLSSVPSRDLTNRDLPAETQTLPRLNETGNFERAFKSSTTRNSIDQRLLGLARKLDQLSRSQEFSRRLVVESSQPVVVDDEYCARSARSAPSDRRSSDVQSEANRSVDDNVHVEEL